MERLRLLRGLPARREEQTRVSHEAALLGVIKEVEVPFLSALRDEFGEKKGWRCCGPASVILSRIISHRTGVPIGLNLPGEHLTVMVGIFDPKNSPDRLARLEEQTYIRYYTGDGSVYYIDPIYGSLMEERVELRNAIQVEKYGEEEIDKALIANHSLYPFDPDHESIETRGVFSLYTTVEKRSECWTDLVTVFNDERATLSGPYLCNHGALLRNLHIKAVIRIIEELVPGWKPNLVVEARQRLRLVPFILGLRKLPRDHRDDIKLPAKK